MQLFASHWHHHSRFYTALVLAVAAYLVAAHYDLPVAHAIGGDVFFAVYLLSSLILAVRLTHRDLDRRADIGDEGALVVFVVTVAAIVFASTGVVTVIREAHAPHLFALLLALAGAPLGWLMLHTVAAFHYANLYYAGPESPERTAPLAFPGEEHPDLWDFFYFSFVIGMTAQVSDVQVSTSAMRRAVLVHSIVSFFFNTVLIAMAVGSVVGIDT